MPFVEQAVGSFVVAADEIVKSLRRVLLDLSPKGEPETRSLRYRALKLNYTVTGGRPE
jgi:hypothetical protein